MNTCILLSYGILCLRNIFSGIISVAAGGLHNSFRRFVREKLHHESGAALLIVIVIGFLVFTAMSMTILSTKSSMQRVSDRKQVISAFNVAEAGKEHALAQLRMGSLIPVPSVSMNVFSNQTFEHGAYSVQCSTNTQKDTVWIVSTGYLAENRSTIRVVSAIKNATTHINPNILAAVTARSSITTLGNIIIDGQDWDYLTETVVGTGVGGIRSCGNITQSGSSKIGGFGTEPGKNATIPVIEHLISPVGYPTTPEEVLGLPANALDKYKTSTMPAMPFTGIVYYTPTGTFQCPDFTGSTGIFICHNDTRSATVKNIHGHLDGILIADRVDHVNANARIYGAVVTLSEIEGTNAFGNGNADVRYSSSIVNKLINTISIATDTTIEVVSWRQVE